MGADIHLPGEGRGHGVGIPFGLYFWKRRNTVLYIPSPVNGSSPGFNPKLVFKSSLSVYNPRAVLHTEL